MFYGEMVFSQLGSMDVVCMLPSLLSFVQVDVGFINVAGVFLSI